MSFTPIFSFGSAGEGDTNQVQVVPIPPAASVGALEQSNPRLANYLADSIERCSRSPLFKTPNEDYPIMRELLFGKAAGTHGFNISYVHQP